MRPHARYLRNASLAVLGWFSDVSPIESLRGWMATRAYLVYLAALALTWAGTVFLAFWEKPFVFPAHGIHFSPFE